MSDYADTPKVISKEDAAEIVEGLEYWVNDFCLPVKPARSLYANIHGYHSATNPGLLPKWENTKVGDFLEKELEEWYVVFPHLIELMSKRISLLEEELVGMEVK